MSKRKLNRRQKWRIEKIQAEKLQRLQQNETDIKDLHENYHSGDRRQGLVVAKHGKQIEIIDHTIQHTLAKSTSQISQSIIDNTCLTNTEKNNLDINNAEANNVKENNTSPATFLCHMRANIPDMVVGDQVVWTQLENSDDKQIGVIESLQKRENLLSRRDKHGNDKIIAANVTQVFVVIAQEPETPPAVIDRYLCACRLLGLSVNLLINKSDLKDSQVFFDHLVLHYQSVVNNISLCSIHNEQQLSNLYQSLDQQSSVFIGQSGVGKSSLVKRLISNHTIKTQTLSSRSGLGQHTTSTSRLYLLDSGGCVIDSPGVRDFDLDDVSLQELQTGFKEFSQINGVCKFRNCVHGQEPGCKIREAVKDKRISALRYQNYLTLAEQLQLIK